MDWLRNQTFRALIWICILSAPAVTPHAAAAGAPQAVGTPQVLTLEQCLEMAVQKNHRRPASQFEVAMAEAQHRQALSGYWPQVSLKADYQRLDQPIDFLFPGGAMQIPSQSIAIPGGSTLITIPANAFGPGFPPAAVQMPARST